MDRRLFMKALTATVGSTTLLKFNPSFAQSANSTQLITPLRINLSGPGRVGFYMDYSELNSVGTHTFFVCRTHGTSGSVSVSFSTSGDSHSAASGILSWADGEADIKSFTVDVPGKTVAGDHRVVAQLSNPTGGLTLHNGSYTRAYGVIDDGTTAANNSAVFFDAQAGSNGSGTASSPYNNIYDAIANVGSKRYIYGKGTVVPDGTNTANPNGGGGTANCIKTPAGRNNEGNRVFIQAWPGNKLRIDGSGVTSIGFYAAGGMNWMTFRKIDFTNLNSSSAQYCENGGIMNWKGKSTGINIELCTFNNINGSSNTAAFCGQHVDGLRMWRCASNNIQVNGSNTNQNAGGLCLYYDSTNFSLNRCESSNAGPACYFKRPNAGSVSPVVRFCYLHDCGIGLDYGYGSSSNHQNYAIIQANVFKNLTTYYAIYDRGNAAGASGKQFVSNNVFDSAGRSGNGVFWLQDTYNWQIFNNIMYNSDRIWVNYESKGNNSNSNKNVLEFADYNHTYNSGGYYYLGKQYSNSGQVSSASGGKFAAHDVNSNPRFTSPSTGDYSLQAGSPCLGTGVGGSNKGIYLTGYELIGPSGSLSEITLPDQKAPIKKMNDPSVNVVPRA